MGIYRMSNAPPTIWWRLLHKSAKAGLKQSDVAAALSVHTSRISRLETGDVNAEPEEVQKYLDCLGTDEAERFLSVLGMRWQHVPQPSYAHPQLDAVKTAETYLTKLDAFMEEPGVPRTLLGQATMHRESLQRTADFLSSLDHTVAYVGDIGAGKTTAICLQTDLVLPGFDRNGLN
jgi:hypothetical protein